MGLPRFRVRTLLILVMLAGTGVWGYMMWQRSGEYSWRADLFAQIEGIFRSGAEKSRARLAGARESVESLKLERERLPSSSFHKILGMCEETVAEITSHVTRYERLAEFYKCQKEKCRRAARYPFLHVAPEPPLSEWPLP